MKKLFLLCILITSTQVSFSQFCKNCTYTANLGNTSFSIDSCTNYNTQTELDNAPRALKPL